MQRLSFNDRIIRIDDRPHGVAINYEGAGMVGFGIYRDRYTEPAFVESLTVDHSNLWHLVSWLSRLSDKDTEKPGHLVNSNGASPKSAAAIVVPQESADVEKLTDHIQWLYAGFDGQELSRFGRFPVDEQARQAGLFRPNGSEKVALYAEHSSAGISLYPERSHTRFPVATAVDLGTWILQTAIGVANKTL